MKVKEQLRVSIITIVYNSEKTLEQTILSVIGQSYRNIEYIVVDGGSTDGSIDIINKYKDRISKFISEPDKGISDAFNKGIKMATGILIGIINSDDWYEEDALQMVIDHYSEDFDIYCGNLILIDREEKAFKIKRSMLNRMHIGMHIMHPTTFITKRAYEKAGLFNVGLRTSMDYELIMRFLKMGLKVCYIDKSLASMRATGVSTNNLDAVNNETLAVMKSYLPFFKYIVGYCFIKLNTIRMKFIKIN